MSKANSTGKSLKVNGNKFGLKVHSTYLQKDYAKKGRHIRLFIIIIVNFFFLRCDHEVTQEGIFAEVFAQ